ncbi:MAG: ATP synthase F1 subunit delta [Elusimicrobiota bacterium]|jgi:F-type H+-transporting ATPase subunit delta
MRPGERALARRYAAAFVAAAGAGSADGRASREDQAVKDLAAAAERVAPEEACFRDPRRSMEEKQARLKSLAGQISAVTLRFLHLLLENKRLGLLSAAALESSRVLDDQRGILRAYASAAAPLGAGQEESLRRGLERLSGRKIVLSTRVDEEVLAGVEVRAGDWVLDASLRGRMKRLRESLTAG